MELPIGDRAHEMNIEKLVLITFVLLTACKESTIEEEYNEWYSKAKEKIIQESSQLSDSTYIEVNKKDSTFRIIHSFIKGQKLSIKYFSTDELRASYHYSKDGRLKLVREYWTNEYWAFEEVRYEDKFYGPWTVRHSPEVKNNKNLPYKRREYRFSGKK